MFVSALQVGFLLVRHFRKDNPMAAFSAKFLQFTALVLETDCNTLILGNLKGQDLGAQKIYLQSIATSETLFLVTLRGLYWLHGCMVLVDSDLKPTPLVLAENSKKSHLRSARRAATIALWAFDRYGKRAIPYASASTDSA
jgi:hypothetical protein